MTIMCTDIRATEIRRRLTWSNNLIQCVNGTCNTATGILSQIQLCTVAQVHLPLLNSSTDTINRRVLDFIVLLLHLESDWRKHTLLVSLKPSGCGSNKLKLYRGTHPLITRLMSLRQTPESTHLLL